MKHLYNKFTKWLVGASIFALSISLHASVVCYPQSKLFYPQYVVAYGSLLLEESKEKTLHHTGKNIPIILKGFERGWFMRGFFYTQATTYLGVKSNSSASLNGVIFKLRHPGQLLTLDQREKGYCRQQINVSQMQNLLNKPFSMGQYWIYVPRQEYIALPTSNTPILEYYLDIFLAGCLQIEKTYSLRDYAQQCIRLTSGWSHYRQKTAPMKIKSFDHELNELRRFKKTSMGS